MIETRKRMELIHKRVSRYRSRFEKRMIGSMGMLCLGLISGIGYLLSMKQNPGIFTMQGEYGSILLHNSEEPYIVLGVCAFLGGAAFTILCIRFSQRKRIQKAEEGEN